MMPSAARKETLSLLMMGSGEEVFFLTTALVLLETHGGENGASGKKSRHGIFPTNRTIAVGANWAKSQKTHWESGAVWLETAVGGRRSLQV
jgi:hypothetical protein